MSNEIVALRLEVAAFLETLGGMSSEAWKETAVGETLDRYNALLAEAKRLLPAASLWPRRLESTNEAENLDVLMYAEQLADRLADTDPAGDSGIWRR